MLLKFLKGSRAIFLLCMIAAVLSTIADMLRPRIIQYTVDGILGDSSGSMPAFAASVIGRLGGIDYLASHLWIPALMVLAVTLLAAILKYVFRVLVAKGGERFVKTARDSIFDQLEHLPDSWHSAHSTGDIIQRCTSDVEEVKSFVGDYMVNLLSMALTLGFAIFFMCRVNLTLGLISLISAPLIILFSLWFHKKITETFMQCDIQEGILSSIAQENLTGVRVVRAFGREKAEQEKFEKQNLYVTKRWMMLNRFLCSYWLCSDIIIGFVNIAVLCVGTVLCINGKLTVGGLVAALSYLAMLVRPIRNMGRLISALSKTGVSLKRLREIMDAERETDMPDPVCAPLDRDIEFRNVTFAYPGASPILENVSFKIPAGTTLGILGSTGSGKSTLMQLLDRLLDLPEGSGSITIGGVDIKDMPRKWVRKNIGYVMQEAFLFSRSIKENIAIVSDKEDEDTVIRASKAACLDSAVEKFPSGYDTFVGERGVTLSGGQKQRTAIARALASDTPVIVLDDSLSAVDAQTDANIRRNLAHFMAGSTVIIISHRINSLMSADNIIVMERGRIKEQGTHEELVRLGGSYSRICGIQSGLLPEDTADLNEDKQIYGAKTAGQTPEEEAD